MKTVKIFALSNSKELGEKIAKELGLELGKLELTKFSDGEISPNFLETIRGRKVFIVGSTEQPDSNMIELLLTIDAAKRSGAGSVNCIIPYFGYARQDRKGASRSAIGSRVMVNCLEANGADTVTIVELHATQIEGHFNISTVHIPGHRIFIPTLKNVIKEDWIICSPDVGGTARANKFKNHFGLEMVVIDKTRPKPNVVSNMLLIGDVEGKHVMIVDDMIDTGGSLCKATDLLLEKGALSVSAVITHPVLSGPAYKRIAQSRIEKLYVSDTISLPESKEFGDESIYIPKNKLEIVSCSKAVGIVTKRIIENSSVDAGLELLEV